MPRIGAVRVYDANGALSDNSVLYQSSGTLTDSTNMTFDGTTFFANAIQVNDGSTIDTDAAGTLSIGTTNATTVNIGQSGQTTVIGGNLQVDGTTTTVNSTVLEITDKNIVVNNGSTTTDGALSGIHFEENGVETQGYMRVASDRTNLELKAVGGNILTLDVNADSVFTIGADFTVEATSTINQDVTTDATPTFSDLILSSFTQGSLLFAGASGAINQDNANLFWDDTNNVLGLGTATPNSQMLLDVSSTAAASMPAPRMTTTQRNTMDNTFTVTEAGALIWNTTVGNFQYWDGGTWQDVSAASGVNLQQAYTNTGSEPEITVTPTRGALDIRQDAGGTVTDLFVVANNAGSTEYLNVSTSGITTTSAIVSDLTDNRVVIAGTSGALEDDGNFTYDGTDLSVNSAIVTDLTDNRVVIAGSGGALEDDGNFTYDGTDLTVNSAIVSDLTDNRIIIAGTSGALEDDANFVFTGSALGVGTGSPDDSALVDLTSTARGFLPPRMTEAQRDAINSGTFAEGLMIYNDDDNEINFYDGTQWRGLDAVVSLQDAYDNSTGGTTAEIVLDSTRGAINLAKASGDGDTMFLAMSNNALTSAYFSINNGSDGSDTTILMGTDSTTDTDTLNFVTNGNVEQINFFNGIGFDAINFGLSSATMSINGSTIDLDPNVVIGDTTVDDSAALEIESTTKGFLTPRMTTTQRNAINSGTFADGLIIYNETVDAPQWWDGTQWNTVGNTAGNTLQSGYTNTSSEPEITVTPTRGAVDIRQDSGGTVTDLLIVANNAGSTEYLNVSTSGITTTSAIVSDLTDNRVVIAGTSGALEDDGNFTYDGTDLSVNSAIVTDLTDNRIVIAGSGGALEDDGNFTYDGTDLSVNSAIVTDLTDNRIVIAGSGGALEDDANFVFTGSALGVGTGSPNAASILDVSSTAAGVIFPRMSTAQRDAINSGTFAEGLMVYNTDVSIDGYQFYDGTQWVTISTSANNSNRTELKFADGDLSSGDLSFTHGLGEQFVVVVIYDNNDLQIVPDDVTASSTTVSTVDLDSYGTLTGTWTAVALA